MTRDLPFDPDAVPRDPSAYRQTQHFRQQIRYRQLPSPSVTLVCRAIETGTLKRADRDHQVTFEVATGGYTWRVIADLRRGPPHPLITVYAVNAHGDGEHGLPGVGE